MANYAEKPSKLATRAADVSAQHCLQPTSGTSPFTQKKGGKSSHSSSPLSLQQLVPHHSFAPYETEAISQHVLILKGREILYHTNTYMMVPIRDNGTRSCSKNYFLKLNLGLTMIFLI